MRNLRVEELTHDKIPQAYALLLVSLPSLKLDAWRRYATALIAEPAAAKIPDATGIITVVNEQSYLLGLAGYRIEPDLTHGTVLTVENFHAVDLFDPREAVESLSRGLEEVAQRYNCGAIHTSLLPSRENRNNALSPLLLDVGHRVEGRRYCKRLIG